MAKMIDGIYVVRAKLKGKPEFVYCAGISSNNHVVWTPHLSKAVQIKGVSTTDMKKYVSTIWRHNDFYNQLDIDYAVNIQTVNLTKKPCNYMAMLGRFDSKSEQLGIFETTMMAARAIANHAKEKYPRERYFLYKKKMNFPKQYCQFKYCLIDKTTGEYLTDYYFIMEVSK